ncbi:MAG: signal recognition particle protein [Helicobacter sp.]|nr:signal recognition particle protein [Helicobacter sp.]
MLENLTESFKNVVNKIRFSDDEKSLNLALGELKKSLLKNDVHHKVTKEIVEFVGAKTREQGIGKGAFLDSLSKSLEQILRSSKNYGLNFASKPPTIILMVGLQGSGKTTTCAKLANYMKSRQKKVLLAACDLQRLGAVTQLKTLGESIDVPVFTQDLSPVEIAKNAKKRAIEEDFDALIIDTAGRLAIDSALMNELLLLKNALDPHEIIYVVDSLSGQEGVRTITQFNDALDINGVILSKFDSDTKGGIALNIAHQTSLPLRFVGLGEKISDLDIFLPDRIISRLMGAGDIQGLAEKTSAIINKQEAKALTKKVQKGEFSFTDFLEQIENVKKMGSLSSIMGMIPGLSGMASRLKDIDLDNSSEVKNIRAMVNSMTKKERDNPKILNGSRRLRIAAGSGLKVQDVNRIIKNFENTSKMAKRFSSKGGAAQMMQMLGNNQFKR